MKGRPWADVRARAIVPRRLVRVNDSLRVWLQNPTGYTRVGGTVNAYKDHKVTLSTNPDTIRFDARGFAFGINTATSYQVIRLTRGTLVDSVCVSRFGKVTANGSCT